MLKRINILLLLITTLLLLIATHQVWAESLPQPVAVFAKAVADKPEIDKIKPVKPKISIVVDDLGDNSIIAGQMASLPATLTLAILPHTPFATKISQIALEHGHEVIMHLPMEALSRPDLLGPGALFSNMQQRLFLDTFLKSAESIPNLVGFNNHMGSLLTQNNEKMSWLMNAARQKQWYFLDSRTSKSSVAQTVAENIGLSTIGRDIFLDHHSDTEQLPKIMLSRLEQSKKIALLRGHVVIICHPYSETFEFLAQHLPELSEEFELVKLSELLPKPPTKVANLTEG